MDSKENKTLLNKDAQNSTVAESSVGPNGSKSSLLVVVIVVILLLIIVISAIIVLLLIRRRKHKRARSDKESAIPLTVKINKDPDEVSEADSEMFSEILSQQEDSSFYRTKVRFTIEETMKAKHAAYLIGPAGSGKTSIGKDILLSLFNKKVKGKKCTCKILYRTDEWEEKINSKKITIFMFESCFERWNYMPKTIEDEISSLIRLQSEYLGKANVFAIFTIRSSTWKKFSTKLEEVMNIDNECVFNLSDVNVYSDDEKKNILARHFQENNIVCCDTAQEENMTKPDVLDKNKQARIHTETFVGMVQSSASTQESQYVGYPGTCAMLCYNRRLLGKGKDLFLDPRDILRKDISLLMKSKHEEDKQRFCTLVYTALNGGTITISEKTPFYWMDIRKAIRMKSSTPDTLLIDDHYLVEAKNDVYEFQHEVIMRTVLFVFGEQNPDILINHCDANLLLRYIRTKKCEVADDEDLLVLRKDDNYKLLATRFVDVLDNADIDDVRNHICMTDDKFEDIFAKRYSKEFEGRVKKPNATLVRVRSSVKDSINRMSWKQQTKL